MITREEFDQVQNLLGLKGKPRKRVHAFAFTGMIRCGECGCLITAEDKVKHQKNGNTHHYTYYHCTKKKEGGCTQKTIRVEKLEEQISSVLGMIQIPPEFREWALEVLREENEKEFSGKKAIVEAQQKAYNACLQKFDSLIDMRANQEIDEETFLRKKSEMFQEKERLKGLMESADESIDNWIEKAEELFGFAEIAKFRFETGTLHDKKAILSVLGSNLSLKDEKLLISLPEQLLAMQKASEEEREIRSRLEPLGFASNKAKVRAEYARTNSLLRRLDAIRTCLLYPKLKFLS